MQTWPLEPVDQALVHKCHPSNVLIADLRLMVPCGLYEGSLTQLAERDMAASACLREYYVPAASAGFGARQGERYFVLACLEPILRVRQADLERRVLAAGLADCLPELLASYAPHGDELLLRSDVDERRYERLLAALDIPGPALLIADKLRISRALELLDDAPRAYCASLIVDTSHEFFFEHYIDHVPGLLIIEAARQMGVATELKFRKVPADTLGIVTGLSSEFKGYVDLCLPIDLYCRETSRGEPRPGRPSCDVHLEMVVCQAHRDVAMFKVVGEGVDTKLFKRLRRNRAATLGDRVFAPRPHIAPRTVLSRGALDATNGALAELWLEGFTLKLPDPLRGELDECEFTLMFPEVEDIHGRARVIRQWSENGLSFAELEIIDIGKAGRQTFQEAIAIHCVWTGRSRSTARPAEQQTSHPVAARKPITPG
jgi:hypothetical protein